ncbi:MAG: DUF2207 domain-containing protein [Candidatus Micrarchaeia archaeon]
MDNRQKLEVEFVLLIFLILPIIYAQTYSNPTAFVIYKLNSDGTINVHEEITFYLYCTPYNCYHELYTWHPLLLNIKNESGRCVETNCRFYTNLGIGRYEMVLRKDEGFRSGIYTAIFEYTLPEEILEQKDTAQFFYKIWYDEWPKEIGKLNIKIVLPGPASETVFYTHNFTESQINIKENQIEIIAFNYPSERYYEINLLMPKEWFSKLRKPFIVMTKEQIIKGEDDYLTGNRFEDKILRWLDETQLLKIIAALFLLFPFLMFVYLYFVYGKEREDPEVQSLPPYIRDISDIGEDMTPSEAALLLRPNYSSDMESGLVNRIITAEIMELIRLGYLKLKEEEEKSLFGKTKKVFLIPVEDKDITNLSDVQKTIFSFIKRNLKDGKFSFDIKYHKENGLFSSFFTSEYEFDLLNLIDNVSKQSFEIIKSKRYLNFKGNKIMNISFVIWFIIGLVSFYILDLKNNYSLFFVCLLASWLFYAVLMVFLTLRPEILGRWSKKGRIRHEKILRYRRFMEDLTLLGKKELKEIVFWDKHLVYATAFGIQEKVIKAIKIVEPDYHLSLLEMYVLINSSLFFLNILLIKASFINLLAKGASRGGFGAGGGGGGGGGGAR